MKCKLKRQSLLKNLSLVESISSSRSTIPVLSNILIKANGENVTFTSSNLETSMLVKDEGNIEEEGAIAVNGRKLLSIVRELPEDDIFLATDENFRLEIKSTSEKIKAKFIISGLPETDYPDIKLDPDGEFVPINAEEFKKSIKKVIFAISTDENKYSLTGVFIEKYQGKLHMVGTDGKRLSLIVKSFEGFNTSEELFLIPQEGIIVPRLVLQEVLKIPSEHETIDVSFSQNQIFFSFGNIRLVSTLLEGRFPDYKKIIPPERERYFIADKETLFNGIKRVSLLVDESYNQVKFSLTSGRLVISSRNPALGGAVEEIPVEYSGEDIDIAFNYIFLLDSLKSIDSERVIVEFEDSEKVVTLRGEGEKDYINLIMPMKINI